MQAVLPFTLEERSLDRPSKPYWSQSWYVLVGKLPKVRNRSSWHAVCARRPSCRFCSKGPGDQDFHRHLEKAARWNASGGPRELRQGWSYAADVTALILDRSGGRRSAKGRRASAAPPAPEIS